MKILVVHLLNHTRKALFSGYSGIIHLYSEGYLLIFLYPKSILAIGIKMRLPLVFHNAFCLFFRKGNKGETPSIIEIDALGSSHHQPAICQLHHL